MPSPDVQILAKGDLAAPLAYTLAPQAELILLSLYALFDGSGAAGAFVPCLTIVSPAGNDICRMPGAQVAAGASSEATWAPFLRAAAAPAAASSMPLARQSGTATITVVNTLTHFDCPSAQLSTTDATVFGNALIGAGPNHGITLKKAGRYRIAYGVAVSIGAAGDVCGFNRVPSGAWNAAGPVLEANDSAAGFDTAWVGWEERVTVTTGTGIPAGPLDVYVLNRTNGRGNATVQIYAEYLGAYGLT